MKLAKDWFEVPAGTEIIVTGEATFAIGLGHPEYRYIIVSRADSLPMAGPDGPKMEIGIGETFLDEIVPPQSRSISMLSSLVLK